MKDLRILVVGAGIAGLGGARALRQRGFVADVVEREPAWTDVKAGIYLPGNTVRALRALSLESPVTERAELIPRQRFCDHRGNVVARFQAWRRPRARWVLTQIHRRDSTRNLPPALRDFALRRSGRSMVHTSYRPLLDLP